MKAHTVTTVEESETTLVVQIDRLESRLLRCGICRQRCRRLHNRQTKERMGGTSRCGIAAWYSAISPSGCAVRAAGSASRTFPWAAGPWGGCDQSPEPRCGSAGPKLSGQETARHYRLNWKTVAAIVRRAVAYGLRHQKRRPLHVLGVNEVSRRKGHHYLTSPWSTTWNAASCSRSARSAPPKRWPASFAIWAAYLRAVREHALQARILFGRFHLVQHLNRALGQTRRLEMQLRRSHLSQLRAASPARRYVITLLGDEP